MPELAREREELSNIDSRSSSDVDVRWLEPVPGYGLRQPGDMEDLDEFDGRRIFARGRIASGAA